MKLLKIALNPWPIDLVVEEKQLSVGISAQVLDLDMQTCTILMQIAPETTAMAVSKQPDLLTHFHAIIAHECLHVIQAIENFLNEKLSDETAAYTLEFLIDKICSKLCK